MDVKEESFEISFDWFYSKVIFWTLVALIVSLIILFYINIIMGYVIFHLYVFGLYIVGKKRNTKLREKYLWGKYQARVLSTKIQKYACGKRWGYYPKIKYTYIINEKRYISDNFFPIECEGFYTKEKAKELLEKLVKDFKVSAYVNPDEPSESFLIRGEKGEFEFPLIILLVLYIIPYNTIFYYLMFA